QTHRLWAWHPLLPGRATGPPGSAGRDSLALAPTARDTPDGRGARAPSDHRLPRPQSSPRLRIAPSPHYNSRGHSGRGTCYTGAAESLLLPHVILHILLEASHHA